MDTLLLKPPRLHTGSKVAIVSPSWGGPSRFPDIYELGLKNLPRKIVIKVVREEFGVSIPIIRECDFGHTDPQWVLPLGVQARIDCTRQSITLLEPAVS